MAKRSFPATGRLLLKLALFGIVAGVGYGAWLSWKVTSEFDSRGWDRPARVYAAPIEIYGGRKLSIEDLAVELDRLGYARVQGTPSLGRYRQSRSEIDVWLRPFELPGSSISDRRVTIQFSAQQISSVLGANGEAIAVMQLEPLMIGSIFPAHGEDRLIVAPDEIPPLLAAALIAVEDRRFERHLGIDIRGVVRAALVNLTSGEIRQGASTLTQQLVRSYFLTNDRTWSRKIREAFMALMLEVRHSKDELLHAYINEVYLGQDGGRAIHGFGLASRFYFGKPLAELDLDEIAVLIAVVRGPSFYDPRRQPLRALARRGLVLNQMLDQGIISADAHAAANTRGLSIVDTASRRASYYAAFLDLVRRQLSRDYAAQDLTASGLSIYTTLDPMMQSASELALTLELDHLQLERPELEGAVLVTNPHNAEVRAIVGSRRTGFDGFNRALDARRQVGSLIKPAVYLAALESGRHSLATLVDDAPIDVPLGNGENWSPGNFNGESHGTVTAIRALAESFNMATVRLGLDVGLEPVADVLRRLGVERKPALFPSLLLGALELTPFEVTQAYNSLANGGFRAPLRSVRAVADRDGVTLNRYRLTIEPVSDPSTVYALNQALVQTMERGTGRSARAQIPSGLVTAGKTGTSDGFRDSWFAGFSSDTLIVAWIGNDDNLPTGLTGSTGAARVWSTIMRDIETSAYHVPPPSGYESIWIDYGTGLQTDASCVDAVALSMMSREIPPKAVACGSDRVRVGQRVRQWLRNVLN
jgi:penicillin-binding protein 1B